MNPKAARDQVNQVLGRKPGESTRRQYERQGASVLGRLKERGYAVHPLGLMQLREDEGWRKGSTYRARAAALYVQATRTRDALQAYNRADKAGDKEQAREHLAEVKRLGRQLEALREPLPDMKREKPANSARRRLRPAQDAAAKAGHKDWRVAVVHAMPKRDQGLAAVMSVTGCRPSELGPDGGVTVRTEGGKLVCEIQATKWNASRGQPTRTLRIDPANGPLERGLFESVQRAGGSEHYQTLPGDSARAFSERLKHHATRTLGVQIDTYCYRHQLASDLKASLGGGEAALETIAQALGHTTDQCQRLYGCRELGSGGKSLQAAAERDVSHHKDGPEAKMSKEPASMRQETKQRARARAGGPARDSGPDHQMEMGG